MPHPSPSLGLLRRAPPFAALLAARGVSLVGDSIGGLALIIHVQRVQGTGTAIGLLLLADSLPRLLSPVAGIVADRVDQRRVLVAAELAQAVLIGTVAVWLPPLPILLALLLGKGVVTTIGEPAGRSAIPALVDDVDLPTANALLGGARQLGEVLGPLLGAVLVATAGVRAGLVVDAVTFVVAVPLLARLPALAADVREESEIKTGVAADARAGLRYVAGHSVTLAVTVGFLFVGLTAADDVALPFLARTLGAGELGIGALYSAVAGGLIIGYLGTALWRWSRPTRGFLFGMALVAVANGLTGVAPVLVAAVAFQLTRGVGIAILETNLQTLIQRTTPRRLLGRVFANVYGTVHIAASLSLLAGGLLLDATSPRTVLIAVGLVGLTGTGLTAALLRRGPLET